MFQQAPHRSATRYFDRAFQSDAVKIVAGEYFATAEGIGISTLLGSCVSVCLYDKSAGVGGMNHFMLPESLLKDNATRCSSPDAVSCTAPCSARYGACAMRQLIAELERLGARPGGLEAKVFGAGRVMEGPQIGEKNAAFALGYLRERGIPVQGADLGDGCPRKVFFFPASGRAFVRRITGRGQETR